MKVVISEQTQARALETQKMGKNSKIKQEKVEILQKELHKAKETVDELNVSLLTCKQEQDRYTKIVSLAVSRVID